MAALSAVRVTLLARVGDGEPVELAVVDAPVTAKSSGREVVVRLEADAFVERLRAVVEAVGRACEEPV